MDIEKKVEKINKLKQKKDVLLLAHNYQISDIQDVADIVGDSLELAKKATETENKNIIFCGVDFMAESAKILNPDKNIILPDVEAKCPMAGMVDVKRLNKMKKQHHEAKVVSYINTTADIKAISDICCTSSNGEKVVKKVDAKKVIFVPDRNLGRYIQRFVKDKEMILWDGFCYTHDQITRKQILKKKEENPDAEILVHPECRPKIIDIADYAYSTNGMVNHVKSSEKKSFIIGTEKDLCYRLRKENPDKKIISIDTAVCKDMKKITLDKVINSLQKLEPKISLSKKIMIDAKKPLKRMMEIGRGD
ncbi:MAG: quinolinate synthase NadA [Candidatus Thermoplasmatota archaeon]